jgi:hypothetical protein
MNPITDPIESIMRRFGVHGEIRFLLYGVTSLWRTGCMHIAPPASYYCHAFFQPDQSAWTFQLLSDVTLGTHESDFKPFVVSRFPGYDKSLLPYSW